MSCVGALIESFYASKEKNSKTLSFETKGREVMDILEKVSQTPECFIQLIPGQQQKLI